MCNVGKGQGPVRALLYLEYGVIGADSAGTIRQKDSASEGRPKQSDGLLQRRVLVLGLGALTQNAASVKVGLKRIHLNRVHYLMYVEVPYTFLNRFLAASPCVYRAATSDSVSVSMVMVLGTETNWGFLRAGFRI